jgi:hypothetical protein
MNPYVFWDKAPKERELFILEDYEDKARMNYNPDHDTKLLPG